MSLVLLTKFKKPQRKYTVSKCPLGYSTPSVENPFRFSRQEEGEAKVAGAHRSP